MGRFVRLCGHVPYSGFVWSTGHSTIFPCSSSPGLQLFSSSLESWADLVGDFGGCSSIFVGGALVFGAGGGGALLLDFLLSQELCLFLAHGVVLEVGLLLIRAFPLFLILSLSLFFDDLVVSVQFFLRLINLFPPVLQSVAFLLFFNLLLFLFGFFVLLGFVM